MRNSVAIMLIAFTGVVLSSKAQGPIIYGTTVEGGLYNSGTIFNLNESTGNETVLFSFQDSLTGTGPSSLIKAADDAIYGYTTQGGPMGGGTLYRFDRDSNSITILHNFGTIPGTSYSLGPNGPLLQAKNGLLYGLTRYDLTDSGGLIFSYNILTAAFQTEHVFRPSIEGNLPVNCSLIQFNDSTLIGMNSRGATYGFGTLFSLNTNTKILSVLHNFGNGNDGWQCTSHPVKANNGLLYGTTSLGGAFSKGIIFSYNMQTRVYTDVYDFKGELDGGQPWGAMIQANDGLLYGISQGGGSDSAGVIFSYNINNNTETALHNFGIGHDGFYSFNAFAQGANGLLYAMSKFGGTAAQGTLFSFDISQSMENVLVNFNGSNGADPWGELIEIADTATSVNNVGTDKAQLQISPNPSNGLFKIIFAEQENNYTFDIYNSIGQRIQHRASGNTDNTIDLIGQAAGVYLVYLHTKEGFVAAKAIIQN